MSVVQWEKDGTVAVITMCNGENRQNLNFANAMLKAFDEIIADESNKAIIITSNDEKNFSQGIDVGWLMDRFQAQDTAVMKDFLYKMNEVFKRCLLLPVPVIAALNGHAFGNGAMLACACDFRFMRSDRGFFCFPEVDIDIPFLPGMLAWCKKAIPDYYFYELYLTGKRATAPEMEQNRVLVKACDTKEDLLKETMEFARTFQKKRAIFGEHKKRLHKGIIDVMDTEDPPVIESLKLMVQG